MKRLASFLLILCMGLGIFAQDQKAKYVFYFIGDGMGFDHVSATEYYLGYKSGIHGSLPVCFSLFPVFGNAVTHSVSNLITDSAAAGTALATGSKTTNGMIGVTSDSTALVSIATKIHNAGYKVGISSTVSINHATPAAFYAHNASRNDYYGIALEMPGSGFEFFGGGGIIGYNEKSRRSSEYNLLERKGYTIVEGLQEYEKEKGAEKIMLLQEEGKGKDCLPYAIDMQEGDMTQADIVRVAIDHLYDTTGEKGFFLMSEGGKIDWASHANDTKTVLEEMISFSDAIEVAYSFYLEHPDETLIVVTADHETGGLTMCWENGYHIYFRELDEITESKDKMTEDEKEEADEASHKAHIGWTSFSHAGSNVPVYAIGAGSKLFSGRMDNTDIPRKICTALEVEF